MSNEGFFDLGLLDTADRQANDRDVKVRFLRITDPTKAVVQATNLMFPPKCRFTLPAFPQAINLMCEVAAPRFRQRRSDVFTLTDGETIVRNLTLFRRPEKWEAEFVAWNQLAHHFSPLQKILELSPDVKVKGSKAHDKFTESAYDDAKDKTTIDDTGEGVTAQPLYETVCDERADRRKRSVALVRRTDYRVRARAVYRYRQPAYGTDRSHDQRPHRAIQ